MADVNLTATLQGVQNANPELELITDQSLNAGSLLPSEPFVQDDRVTEIKASEEVLRQALPDETVLDQLQVAAESRYTEFSYLREDIVGARGMSQKFATEALSIKPGFGNQKPLNYYSKLPSQTRFVAALEEIDQTVQEDLVAQLKVLAGGLQDFLQIPITDLTGPSFNWEQRQVTAGVVGFSVAAVWQEMQHQKTNYDEDRLQDIVLAPATPNNVSDARIYLQYAEALADRSAYFKLYLHLPVMLELLTLHIQAWVEAIQNFLTEVQVEGGRGVKLVPPAMLKVTLLNNATPLSNVGDLMDDIRANEAKAGLTTNPATRTHRLVEAAAEAPVGEIVNRLQTASQAAETFVATIQALAEYLAIVDGRSEQLTFLTEVVHGATGAMAETNKTIRACLSRSALYAIDFRDSLYHNTRVVEAMVARAWVEMQAEPPLYQTQEAARANIALAMKDLNDCVNSLKA